MTRADIVQVSSKRPVDERTARAIVAAQLRGEARTEAHVGQKVVRAIATELEQSGFVPDLPELNRRYHATDGADRHLHASA
ncbi:MAG TPA: hypothetical protein VFX00_09410 [Pedococcus sp.]|jgi:hypothetical protein|nr:hypothetical protein [Pedococcus sp.]